MAYFIVNYQLNKDGQDYQNLWDEFERLEAQKAQIGRASCRERV